MHCAILPAITLGLGAALTALPTAGAPDHQLASIDGIRTNAPVTTAAELDAYLLSDAPKTVIMRTGTVEIETVLTGHVERPGENWWDAR